MTRALLTVHEETDPHFGKHPGRGSRGTEQGREKAAPLRPRARPVPGVLPGGRKGTGGDRVPGSAAGVRGVEMMLSAAASQGKVPDKGATSVQ